MRGIAVRKADIVSIALECIGEGAPTYGELADCFQTARRQTISRRAADYHLEILVDAIKSGRAEPIRRFRIGRNTYFTVRDTVADRAMDLALEFVLAFYAVGEEVRKNYHQMKKETLANAVGRVIRGKTRADMPESYQPYPLLATCPRCRKESTLSILLIGVRDVAVCGNCERLTEIGPNPEAMKAQVNMLDVISLVAPGALFKAVEDAFERVKAKHPRANAIRESI